jgi:hypothetical protein
VAGRRIYGGRARDLSPHESRGRRPRRVVPLSPRIRCVGEPEDPEGRWSLSDPACYPTDMRWRLGLSIGFIVLLGGNAAWAQCQTDADCRGARICQRGQCVEAAGQPCGKDTDCPEPMVCTQAQCAMPAGSTVAPPPPSSGREIVYAEEEVRGVPAVWVPGIITFGVAYVATIGITAGVTDDFVYDVGERIALAAIPIFGPFALMPDASDDYIAPARHLGLFQVAGTGFFIAGLVMKRTVRTPVGVALGRGDDPLYLSVVPGPVGRPDSLDSTCRCSGSERPAHTEAGTVFLGSLSIPSVSFRR